MTSQAQEFQAPARFAAKLNGDKKRAAQTFLCHRLAAFNHAADTLPENSTFEFRHRFPDGRAQFAGIVPVGDESSHDAH